MPQDLKGILRLIDELRRKLHNESEGKLLTDPEVVEASEELNRVLNKYYGLLKEKEEKG
ncbi:aspartyl-phosphate phosphatase Spo0E family protein [Desulforamulus ruminis]|uniref:Spo0E like sporulation regulatory protein n=1 Tax=Desulforamulus ruminis (strain ATCC 23193 / DSM 2154 / NCIMB 8452 / DL) TaxID=696281 RepID=F6DKX6_DESRL|nr:aspartyl-phosphate phosphatase Spo0E family protein [Desulforamulus ruminis]AEG61608.1 hypothetical protein Desru_3404 [Desulforamulus ruminis DSM 2154]